MGVFFIMALQHSIYLHLCVILSVPLQMQRPKDSLWEIVLSFHLVGLSDPTQAVRWTSIFPAEPSCWPCLKLAFCSLFIVSVFFPTGVCVGVCVPVFMVIDMEPTDCPEVPAF